MAMKSIAERRLVVPPGVQRRAGIKRGDRLSFTASAGIITITAVDKPTYSPTETELKAIRRGEKQIARGEYVVLADLIHEVDGRRRRVGGKKSRKVPR